jgi:hypothetical protein
VIVLPQNLLGFHENRYKTCNNQNKAIHFQILQRVEASLQFFEVEIFIDSETFSVALIAK